MFNMFILCCVLFGERRAVGGKHADANKNVEFAILPVLPVTEHHPRTPHSKHEHCTRIINRLRRTHTHTHTHSTTHKQNHTAPSHSKRIQAEHIQQTDALAVTRAERLSYTCKTLYTSHTRIPSRTALALCVSVCNLIVMSPPQLKCRQWPTYVHMC